ncbi:hypothetical protein WMY93_000723 [Mugilogobius chulae]|uniref:TROVE domain-containing protein n=1 Tax=Mugilogobius chulae TaxID=88201 RepID=A0AAW0QAV0_9GOBI
MQEVYHPEQAAKDPIPSHSAPKLSVLSTALPGSALLNRFVHGGAKETDGGDQGRDTPILVSCAGEDTTVHYSEDDVDMSEEESFTFDEEEEEESASAIFESPDLVEEEMEATLMEAEVTTPEFEELKRNENEREEQLNDKKYLLLNIVCCSLVNKTKSPGQTDWDKEDSVWTKLINLAKHISEQDPQFLLKVAVYTRQELNIRITANFLLALAANLTSTKSHVRRYFCAAVQLPSDWLEVVRIYSTCFSRSLPMCLKKGLTDKFKQFSEYQLAKYNTRKHRCKHNSKKSKGKKPSEQQIKRWANLVRAEPQVIKKLIAGDPKRQVVDKKQSEFSLKKMIKRLHIKDPAEYVMAILGRKYPSDVKAFTHSGIKGSWDRDRAGKRMKLKEPETWERLLCQEGNKAATWEKLIDNNSLPFMAMLRNLRNMITTGISETHHKKILNKLTNKKSVIQSRQFPIRFLSAYKVIMELQNLSTATTEEVPARKDILKEVLKKIPKSQRFKSQDWDQTPKSRLRTTLSVPLVYRLYKTKRAQLLAAAGKQTYSVELLQRYRDALEKAVQISCRYNIPPLPGKTVLLLYMNSEGERCSQDFCLPRTRPWSHERDAGSGGGEATPNQTIRCLQLNWMKWTMTKKTDMKDYFTFSRQNKVHFPLRFSVSTRLVLILSPTLKPFQVDNIIVVTESWTSCQVEWAVNNYRNEVNNKALYVQIYLNSNQSEDFSDRNEVKLSGFSDQILRFVAERGSSRLLDHVEHLDKVYNIPPPEGAKEPASGSTAVSIPASPSMRWKSVRVFVSSTFRDMHSERDVLVRSVFPELRRRAAPHCLYLQEVELRWGVTEEESGRSVELCLKEVCRSQVMVVLLGRDMDWCRPNRSCRSCHTKDMRPVNIVEELGFKELMHIVEPRFTVPARETVRRALNTRFEDVRSKIQQSLQCAQAVSITTDLWSSLRMEAYMTVTAHCINADWEMQSFVLETKQMEETHTGDNIAARLCQVVDSYQY